MRLFIAAEIDEKNKKLIHGVQEKFKGSASGGNFTRKENYHITLRFLGEVGDALLPKITFAMDRAAEESAPFTFSIGTPGYFSRREGIVLFLGIENGSENLWKLSSSLDEGLLKSGFPGNDEIFTPHITLGRKVRLRKDFKAITESLDIPEISVKTDHLTLMKSVSEKGILCYREIYSVKLQL